MCLARPRSESARRVGRVLGLLVACLCLGAPAFLGPARAEAGAVPEETADAEVRDRVKALLDDLRSPSFAVRERARQGLERHGPRARDLIEAHRDDEDPEVRRTVRMLLSAMGRPAPVPEPTPGDLSAVGIVSFSREATPAELFAALGEPHGARFTLPEDHDPSPVSVTVDGMPFYAALEKLCGAMGLEAPDAFDASGMLELRVRAEAGEHAPWAAAGPLRVRVLEVSATRTLGAEPTRRYAVTLEMHWAPSVQVMQYGTPHEIVAEDAQGRTYRRSTMGPTNVVRGVSTSARQAAVTIHLEPDAEGAEERLAVLEFVLPLRLRHDRRAVRFSDLEALPATLRADGAPADDPDAPGAVTLQRVVQPDGERGPWVADVSAVLPEASAQRSLQVALERDDGTLGPAMGGSRSFSADGHIQLSARAYVRWESGPQAAIVTWHRREEEGEVSIRLEGVPLR
jgi:hypothetical protein